MTLWNKIQEWVRGVKPEPLSKDDIVDDDARKKYDAIQHYIRCHRNIGFIVLDLPSWSFFGTNGEFAIDGVRVIINYFNSDSNFFYVYNIRGEAFAQCSFDEWHNKTTSLEQQTPITSTSPPPAWCEATMQIKSTPPTPPPSAWCEDTN